MKFFCSSFWRFFTVCASRFSSGGRSAGSAVCSSDALPDLPESVWVGRSR